MTTPDELFEYIDRDGYERACAVAKIEPLPDDQVSRMAETAYELFFNLNDGGGSAADKAVLATHIRRGYSIIGAAR